MAGLFGKRRAVDSTILIVDIENASVGCALVRLSPGNPPRLFAETRSSLPLLKTTSAERLLAETDKSLREALLNTSMTAARMRNHVKLHPVGVISEVFVFVAPPWTAVAPRGDKLVWQVEPALMNSARDAVQDIFGILPTTFHAASSAAIDATNRLFQQLPNLLLCIMTGEVTELASLQNGMLAARATIPLGRHFLLRTLQTHGAVSLAEAESALRLSRMARMEVPGEEALFSAAKHFASEFRNAAKEIKNDEPIHGILVVAQEPAGEWVAQNLATSESLVELFDAGTTVQALHTHHLAPYLAAHAARPDLLFMTEALFVDNQK